MRARESFVRRHAKCPIDGRPQLTFESDEQRRGWKPCSCPIHWYGPLAGGKAKRRSTGATDWDRAREVVKAWKAGQPTPPPPAPEPTKDQKPAGVSIETAAKGYIAEHERVGSAKNTIKKYKILTEKVKAFSTDVKHYHLPAQWTVADVREF